MAKEIKLRENATRLPVLRVYAGKFYAKEIKALRPQLPQMPLQGHNYLRCDQAPYLKPLIFAAHAAGYDQEALASAWCKMLNNKSNRISYEYKKRLTLAEALTVFFEKLSYYETKLHYCVFLEYNTRPERH